MLELMPGYRLGRWMEPTGAMEEEAGEKARDGDEVMEVAVDVEVVGRYGEETRVGEEKKLPRLLKENCRK